MNCKASWLAWFIFMALSIFCIATNPFANAVLGDSAVFAYVGRRILDGAVPYRDILEHKGPMIFYINALGLSIPYKYVGLWIIECIFFFASVKIIYDFGSRYFSRSSCYATEVLCWMFVGIFLNGCYGNLTETYAYPVILWVLCSVYVHVLENRRVSLLTSFGFGVAFIFLFLLRANLVLVAFIVAMFYIDEFVRTHDVKLMASRSMATIAGMLVLLIPFVAYFFVNDSLFAAFDGSILLNLKYVAESVFALTSNHKLVIGVALLNIVVLVRNWRNPWRRVLVYNLVFLLLNLLSIIPTEGYPHYFIMAVPGFIVPFALILDEHWLQKKFVVFVVSLFALLGIGLTMLKANLDVGGYVCHVKSGGDITDILKYREGANYKELVDVSKEIDDRKSVLIAGYPYYYMVADVSCEYKYCFALNDNRKVFKELRDDAHAHLSSAEEKYVIVDKNTTSRATMDLALKNYTIQKETDNFLLLKKIVRP